MLVSLYSERIGMTSEAIIEQVAQVFSDDDLVLERCEAHAIRAGFRENVGRLEIFVNADDEPPILHIVVSLPVACPEERQGRAMELICRLNDGLRLGGFGIDPEDGELTYKASVVLAVSDLTPEQLRAAVGMTMSACVKYARAFGRLIFDPELSPVEAVAEVEMSGKRRRK